MESLHLPTLCVNPRLSLVYSSHRSRPIWLNRPQNDFNLLRVFWYLWVFSRGQLFKSPRTCLKLVPLLETVQRRHPLLRSIRDFTFYFSSFDQFVVGGPSESGDLCSFTVTYSKPVFRHVLTSGPTEEDSRDKGGRERVVTTPLPTETKLYGGFCIL